MFFSARYVLLLWVVMTPIVSAIETVDMEVEVVPAITDNYILEDYMPTVGEQRAAIRMVAAPNEYEPASFVVFANEEISGLQLTATDIVDLDGNVLSDAFLDIRIVKRWYQRILSAYSNSVNPRLRFLTPELLVYDDALIKTEGTDNYLRLDSGEYIKISKPGRRRSTFAPKPDEFPVRDASSLQPLTIAKNSNRQFWVTLYVPINAKAGNYRAEIKLLQGDRVKQVIPVVIEVLPFQLDEPLLHYSIYYKGKLDKDWPDGSVSSEYKSEEQMLSDFYNLAAHGIKNPQIYQHFSTGFLPKVLELREQAGLDNKRIYYPGVPATSRTDGEVSRGLTDTIKEVLAATSKYGVEDVYFYARDEGRKEELVKQFSTWEVVTQAGGKIMAAGWQSGGEKAGNFDVTGGRENLFVSLGALRRQEARLWHAKGRLIYSYQNPTGGWEIAETWRRNYGLLLWQHEYDGGMPYAWQHSYGDAWNDFDHVQYKDHNFTYPTADGQIDTIQWEGLREGVDDVRYLSTLINALAEVKGADSPHEAEARAWLIALKDKSLGQSDLSAIRAEMVAHIMTLKGLVPAHISGAIEGVNVLPIEPGGVVTVTWETAERSPGFLQINRDDEVISASAQGLALNHKLSLAGLEPDKEYPFIAYSYVGADDLPVQHEGVINTSAAMDLTASTSSSAGPSKSKRDLLMDLDIKSNYRSSVGVDWQRSLAGWWRFTSAKSPGQDSSSWGNKAVLKGDARLKKGWFGNGVSLDGAGDFINMPDIDIPKNGAATIEGWFRFRSFAFDNHTSMQIFSRLYQHASTNNFFIQGTVDFFMVGSMLQLDTWHHIAMTWNGDSATAFIYIDGQRVPLLVRGKEIEDMEGIDGLNIGRSYGYWGGLIGPEANTFDGDVDEIRVWSRALSDEEIQASYKANASGMRLRYNFPPGDEATPYFSLIGANAADEMVAE